MENGKEEERTRELTGGTHERSPRASTDRTQMVMWTEAVPTQIYSDG